MLLNAIFSFGMQIQQQNNMQNIFKSNVNIAAAICVLTLELGVLTFVAFKAKEKDKNFTYHS